MKTVNGNFGQTVDAQTGQVVNDATTAASITPSTTASIINIPPQIATTVCWIALGFALCWWFTCRKTSHRREEP